MTSVGLRARHSKKKIQQLMQFHCGRSTIVADGNPVVNATATKSCIEQNHIK
jgi:hypothetical protein